MLFGILLPVNALQAQQLPVVAGAPADRFLALQQQLRVLGDSTAKGLQETANLSVSNAPIQEFVRGLALTHNLNVSIDPTLDLRITNSFTEVKVIDLIVFLAREYNLDIQVIGNIIRVYKFVPPPEIKRLPPGKKLRLSYDPAHDIFTSDLQNDSLTTFAKQVTQLTKRNVVLAPGLGTRLVSGYVEGMPLSQALDKLAYTNSLRLLHPDNASYVLEATDATASAPASRSRRAVLGATGSISNPGQESSSGADIGVATGADGRRYLRIEAENVAMGKLLTDVSQELNINYVLFSELTGNTTMHVKQVTYDDFLRILLQGTTHTYQQSEGLYTIGNRALEGFRHTAVVKMQFRPVDKLDEFIPAELKKGVEIRLFKELNSMILSGGAPQIAEITEFLKAVDKPVVNVLIEVIVVELRRGHSTKTGIRAFLGDSTVRTGGELFPGLDMTIGSKSINSLLSRLGSKGLVNLGRVTPNFYLTLQALEQNSYLNLRSTPKLSTLNGHEANLKIGQSVYYVEENQNVTGGVNPVITKTQQFKQVSADLSIKINPMVSGNEDITLDVSAEFSDFIEPTIQRAPPGTATRQFTSMIRVKNEEMIVLGGLEEIRKNSGGTGVPLLSRIPVLKWLFSTRQEGKQTNRLVVFIRPTIMY
ncbi:type II and III secretion system protein [Hymenobacter norwichensis]|uniref:type II secretion system protein GspD n=1 Tax=Hymenobacter telluris TaxID=2816474 RepID=UPI001A8C12E0|nr:type II and III secretion system protein [Hymenobacter telluris]MBW3376843.1 type II and III secretion system protein [Hymenobacter norwichensis]